jgi:dTDP-D-glucose 4,6-dehydratase
VYAEKDYNNNYIYKLVKEAVINGKIEHKGDGEEIREYIHASDAAKLSVDVLESDEFTNIHVILTGNERLKRIELFNMINEILDNKIRENLEKIVPKYFVPTHNDCHFHNVIISTKDQILYLIDYEFFSPNYRGFELGNFYN